MVYRKTNENTKGEFKMKYVIKSDKMCGSFYKKGNHWVSDISNATHYSRFNPLRFIVIMNLRKEISDAKFSKVVFLSANFSLFYNLTNKRK